MNGRWAFAAAYAGSGAAGLTYQVVWTRLLSTYLGHTVASAGTVLAAFMGGLAVGALGVAWWGRRTRGLDPRRAFRLYAAVEVFVALCALALPFALQATTPLLARAYGESPGPAFAVARVAAALLLVFLPAAAMGTTYPIAVVAAGGDSSGGGRAADANQAGRLYALNTAGAAIGATLAGFVFIPAVGLTRTTLIGVLLNVVAATVAWRLARGEHGALAPSTQPQSPAPAAKHRTPGAKHSARTPRTKPEAQRIAEAAVPVWIASAIAGLSGLAALIYEVAFTRALALVLGPTSYAFAAMLAAFITGMAIGATVAARSVRRASAAKTMVVWTLMVVAAAAAVAAWFTGSRLPLVIATAVASAVTGSSAGATTVLTLASLYAAAVLLPLGIALGAVFPLCLVLASRDGELPNGQAAWLYGINTVGAIAGSLAAAFLLVPTLGVRQTLNLGATISLIAAALALALPIGRTRLKPVPLAAIAGVGTLLAALPAWDVNLLTAGGYRYATDVRELRLDLDVGLRAGRLEYFREGAAGAVSVRRLAGTLAMAIDGKVDASNGPDMVTQKLLAHLPLLLHDNPEEVCIIGLGSGVTLGAALTHPVTRADVVEISPEVLLSRVDNVITNSPTNRQVYDGFEVALQARLRNGGTLIANSTTQRTRTNLCDVRDDPNLLRFCDRFSLPDGYRIPFRADFKLAFSYPVYSGIMASVAFTSSPGRQEGNIVPVDEQLPIFWNLTRTTRYTAEDCAGRPCTPGALVIPNMVQTNIVLPLVPSGSTRYLERLNQLDLSLRRTFRARKLELTPELDIYNALNADTVTAERSANFGTAAYRVPQSVLLGRLMRLAIRVKW